MSTKRKDPLEATVKREELRKAEEARKNCVHPHLRIEAHGTVMRCIDCNSRFGKLLDKGGVEFMMFDFGHLHPKNIDGEMRHSPNEAPRSTKIR